MSALLGALLAGLVGSPHCVGMCGGFAVACGGRPGHHGAYHLGRLTTYAALGGLAGGVGAVLPGPPWVGTALAAAMLVWFALALAGFVPEPRLALPGVSRAGVWLAGRSGVGARLAFGLINGLLPCGLLYTALGVPVALGSPVTGALAMVLFGLGTVPALVAASLGLRRVLAGARWRRVLLAGLVLAAGGWTLVERATATEPEACHEAPPADPS